MSIGTQLTKKWNKNLYNIFVLCYKNDCAGLIAEILQQLYFNLIIYSYFK